MASIAQANLEHLLKEGGFIQGERWSSGLLNAERVKTDVTTDLRYGHLLNTSSKNDPIIDLVYEVPSSIANAPGIPSIYFKVFDEIPSLEAIRNLRSQVWNQGRTPTLWIVTPNSVLIYDSFARPQKNENRRSHLLEELKAIHGQLQVLNAFHKNQFDTGNFWQSDYGRNIKKEQRVDVAMLADLSATEQILLNELALSRPDVSPEQRISTTHALLGRTIFISYLVDRGLLDFSFLEQEYQHVSFLDLLDSKEATYVFFKWLRKTFNGDLFPLVDIEEELVESQHLKIIKEFLLGTDMESYLRHGVVQRSLWPYKFDFIPIELISSIYEMFAHSRDAHAAAARSVHYTRLPLVELVLSIAMRNIPHNAKVLDPACGSGIFLVEAFRRLVWKKIKEEGRLVERHELHHMLRSQIFGIDIDPDAVSITAFSLYLALLELDPVPQPMSALKFPSLLHADTQFPWPPNLYVQDFCNTEHIFNRNEPFRGKGFDLIVGNPPWTALTEKNAPHDPEHPISGRQWSLEYCVQNLIPDKKPDQAFMIRVQNFSQPDTRVALIVCSRLFYQQEEPEWLASFLSKVTMEMVINLSDLVDENVLFSENSSVHAGNNSSTRLPASMLLFQLDKPKDNNQVVYISPKWYPAIKKEDEIVITADDVHYLPQKVLKESPFLWKSAFRGIARDYRLLTKVQDLPTLDATLRRASINHLAHRGVSFGRGKQKPTPSNLLGKPYLHSGLNERYHLNIEALPSFEYPTLAEKSNTKYLQLPAIILSRSLKDGRPCIVVAEETDNKHSLIINQMYYGIPASVSFPFLVYRLNAVFNSALAFYMAFMFSSALGWDRKLLEIGDWLQVRLPHSILNNDPNPLWERALTSERWLRKYWQPDLERLSSLDSQVVEMENVLNQAIFQLYDLSEQEMILVKDTVEHVIQPLLAKHLRTKNAYARADFTDLQHYAERLCTQLDGILRYGNLELTATIIEFEQPSLLHVCRFTQKKLGDNEKINFVRLHSIDNILNQIAQELRAEVGDHMYIQRNLRVYEDGGFWIIKGNQKYHWRESAALQDADAVVREHMDEMVEE